MLDLILLGTSGTVPLPGRWLSSLLVRLGSEMMLFDCGEGTQISLRGSGWGLRSLSCICLSHLHADHVAGLPGLLLTVGNAGRVEMLEIYGPPGTEYVVSRLRVIARWLPFEVRVHEVSGGSQIPRNGGSLSTVALDHSTTCLGYRLDVPRARRFDPARAEALGVPVRTWKALQDGRPVTVGNRVVKPAQVLGPARRGLRVGYITDTRPVPGLAQYLAGADLLVMEGTFGDPADAEMAVEKKHMLFSEAAEIARAAEARRLWLTHFSARMPDPERFAEHATRVFPNTTIGHDGLTISLHFEDDEGQAEPGTTSQVVRIAEPPA